jgi:hypothetical protein
VDSGGFGADYLDDRLLDNRFLDNRLLDNRLLEVKDKGK